MENMKSLCTLQLNSANGANEIGRVSKQWSNLMREYFTDADNFGIQFPMDLDVRMKAVVLGAVFLIVSCFVLVARDSRDSLRVTKVSDEEA